MNHRILQTIRHTVFALGVSLCCSLNSTALYAGGDDVVLDPGDSNDSVILSELVDGDVTSVTVGDKKFSVFSYSSVGNMPAASEINVFGFQDQDQNFGLSLHGVFFDLPGDPNESSALLDFNVMVTEEGQQQGYVISDAHLFMVGTDLPDESEISIEESFQGANETLRVFQSTIGNEAGSQLSDWLDFSETSISRQVSLEIAALTDEQASQVAQTSVIDLTFSQVVVPEPSVAMLLMCAGVLTGAGRSRFRV